LAWLSGNCIAALHISRILNSIVLDDGITNAAERDITNAVERVTLQMPPNADFGNIQSSV